MANRDSTTNEPASTIALKPLHKNFTWLPDNIKNDENAKFAEKALIVAQGARTIAGIMRSNLDDLDSIIDGNPTHCLLSAYEIGSLAELMILSLTSLTVDAEERIDRIDFEARKGAK